MNNNPINHQYQISTQDIPPTRDSFLNQGPPGFYKTKSFPGPEYSFDGRNMIASRRRSMDSRSYTLPPSRGRRYSNGTDRVAHKDTSVTFHTVKEPLLGLPTSASFSSSSGFSSFPAPSLPLRASDFNTLSLRSQSPHLPFRAAHHSRQSPNKSKPTLLDGVSNKKETNEADVVSNL